MYGLAVMHTIANSTTMSLINKIGGVKKLSFFESAILNFLFASSPWKLVKIYRLAWLGNFDDYPGFQLKITHANYLLSKQCF